MRLNVGCGEYPAPGWVNIDLRAEDGPRPDVIAGMTALPFPDRSATHVYAGHVLEHITLQAIPAALAELRRILAGELMVVGPDLDRALTDYPEAIPDIHGGGGRWPGDHHQWDATETLTLTLLTSAGFTCHPLPILNVGDPWPVTSRIGWQTAIHCT